MRRVSWWMAPILLALVLRIPGFGDALGNDEAGSAVVGRSWLTGEAGIDGVSLYGAYWMDRPPLLPLVYGLAEVAGGAVGVRVLGAFAALAVVALVMVVATRLADARAGACAGWCAAIGTGAATLRGDHTYGELLAAVPATASIALLVVALATGLDGRTGAESPRQLATVLIAAGALAAAAGLVKQSAIDGVLVGLVLLLLARDRRATSSWFAGAMLTGIALAAWFLTNPLGPAGAWHALAGFRASVLEGGTPNAPTQLLLPLVASGLGALLVIALFQVGRGWRGVLLGSWLAAATIGALGGGFYWPHYLLQLVPPAAVGAGLWLGGRSRRTQLGVLVPLALVAALGPSLRDQMPHWGEQDAAAEMVGRLVARRSEPDDTVEVLHARPGVVHASGLRSTSPYLWTAMQVRELDAERGIVERLSGTNPPTWLVRWNAPGAHDFDDERIDELVERRYRLVARVHQREVLRIVG